MYKKILIATGIISIALIALANIFNDKADVVIYTSLEDYRLSQLYKDLSKKFPDYKIAIEYKTTGELMSKLNNEKQATNCDIVIGVEATNSEILLDNNSDIFYNFTNEFTGDQSPENKYDESVLNLIPKTSYNPSENICKYHVFDKEAGCIIVNKKKLEQESEKQKVEIKIPTSFEDLKNPIYKNLLCMPDPVYSGTGYYWLNGLVSCWGQEKALEYFNDIEANFVGNGFTKSGSEPLMLLKNNSAGIALGMSFQTAREIHNDPTLQSNFELIYFDIDKDGKTYQKASPFTLYTSAVIRSKWEKDKVRSVYKYLYEEWFEIDKYMFDPETIYKSQSTQEFKDKVKEHFGDYPFASSYMPMQEVFNSKYKINLLDAWKGRKKI